LPVPREEHQQGEGGRQQADDAEDVPIALPLMQQQYREGEKSRQGQGGEVHGIAGERLPLRCLGEQSVGDRGDDGAEQQPAGQGAAPIHWPETGLCVIHGSKSRCYVLTGGIARRIMDTGFRISGWLDGFLCHPVTVIVEVK